MKNIMDIIEHFQTHHALKEEREMESSARVGKRRACSERAGQE